MGIMSRALRGENRKSIIKVDEGILEALQEIADLRNTTVDNLIHVQLHSYIKCYERGKVLDLGDIMPFGKYAGLGIEDIIRADSRYICWLAQESSVFKLGLNAINLIEELEEA